jgi:membrane protease YdiL (CAAX protease family)
LKRNDPVRAGLKVGVYVLLYVLVVFFLGPLFGWLGGILVGVIFAGLAAALIANAYALRIYEGKHLADIGMRWNSDAARNLGLGVLGGAGAAVCALLPPIVAGVARFRSDASADVNLATIVFVPVLLLMGAAGEEILFRGYGFQVLLRTMGPYATIVPVGVLFAILHASNPNAEQYWLGLVNTAGFGILFGYAFLRSRDLWLPIGLHYGWNVTLPLFGVNISGITMKVTGYVLEWSVGPLWSGGEYGPEASILTTLLFVLLWLFLWKAPVRRQPNALLDAPEEASHA